MSKHAYFSVPSGRYDLVPAALDLVRFTYTTVGVAELDRSGPESDVFRIAVDGYTNDGLRGALHDLDDVAREFGVDLGDDG